MEKAIQKSIEGLKELPRYATIVIWLNIKAIYRGTKVKGLNLLENAMHVVGLTPVYSLHESSTTQSAINTTGTLNYMVVSSLRKKLKQTPNVHSLAKDLGITKEGVHRLIWLLGDVRNTKNGSGQYSSETISLVRSALQKERILKQTTSQFATPLSLTKNESQLTNKDWGVKGYGISTMGEHYVVNATGI